MKLVRFSTNGQSPRLGALQGDRIADLAASVAATLTARGVVRAHEIATALVPASARDFQFLTTQWMAGKIFETAAPVGPYIADRQEIADPHSLELRTFVNGKQMQRGNTKTFIFDVRYLVSYLSGLMTLSPGDLIATGTPPGVGLGMKPSPVFMQPGDVCRVEIDKLGSLENPVKEA